MRHTSFSLYTGDIDGSKPKTYRKIRKSYSSLRNDDIAGSKPNYSKKFEKRPEVMPDATEKAVDNGASLVYFGPKIPEKKFVKDPLNRDDIDGAKSSQRLPDTKERDLMRVDDIDGARPAIHNLGVEKKSNRNHNYLDYRDVTARKPHVRKFSTNPLVPDYKTNGQQSPNNQSGGLFNSVQVTDEGAAPCAFDSIS